MQESDTYRLNLERLTRIAAENSVELNPDTARVEKVAGLMATNFDAIEEWVCPCKQTVKPAERGVDVVCPCPEWLDELAAKGHCHCRLFLTVKQSEHAG